MSQIIFYLNYLKNFALKFILRNIGGIKHYFKYFDIYIFNIYIFFHVGRFGHYRFKQPRQKKSYNRLLRLFLNPHNVNEPQIVAK